MDQAALYDAIVQKKIAGAGLDVTDPEPMSKVPIHRVTLFFGSLRTILLAG